MRVSWKAHGVHQGHLALNGSRPCSIPGECLRQGQRREPQLIGRSASRKCAPQGGGLLHQGALGFREPVEAAEAFGEAVDKIPKPSRGRRTMVDTEAKKFAVRNSTFAFRRLTEINRSSAEHHAMYTRTNVAVTAQISILQYVSLVKICEHP